MLKLYRRQGDSHAYWETWTRDDGVHVIHFGELGTRGTTKEITCAFVRKSPALVTVTAPSTTTTSAHA